MIRGVLIIFTLFLFTRSEVHEAIDPRALSGDSLLIKITPTYDTTGLLDGYQAFVHTPVCEVDKCYDIEIDFHWDLIGRFHHYDTIPGKGLTKLDHQPFTDSDFEKLQSILKNSTSPLAVYSKEELVMNTRYSEVDGITGATITEIKESVISGAVYSCFTLWHIANGSVTDSLQQLTVDSFSKELVNKMVNRHDQELNYFLINNFSEKDFGAFLKDVLVTIKDGKGHYTKNALEKIPDSVLADSVAQQFFASNFTHLNYFAQVALLKKLNADNLSEEMLLVLQENLEDRNSYKNDLMKQLLRVESP